MRSCTTLVGLVALLLAACPGEPSLPDGNNNNVGPDLSACDGVNCGAHGTCVAAGTQASCICQFNYHAVGLTCERDNQAPAISNLPSRVTAWQYTDGEFDIDAMDPDPSNTLTFALGPNDCDFTPSIDAGMGLVSFTCDSSEICEVTVQVTDDGSPQKEDLRQLTIECNQHLPIILTSPGTTALENTAYSYNVVCNEPAGFALTLATAGNDTCGGSLTDNGNGTGSYTFTPTEQDGGTTCVVSLTCSNGHDSEPQQATVTINEDNQRPTLTNLPATESGPWQTTDSFGASAADDDDPAQSLTWSISADTCSFTPTVDAAGLVSWFCSAGEICTATVRATDDGNPPQFAEAALTIECISTTPSIDSTPPGNASEGLVYQYDITCSEPAGASVSLAVGAADACGGSLVDNGDGSGSYTFTPGEALGGNSCSLSVVCDNGAQQDTQSATVVVAETNAAPTLTNLPASAPSTFTGAADSFTATASDPDVPANNLSFNLVTDDCSFTPTVAAGGQVDWTCSAAPESCVLTLRVSDDGTPIMSDDATLTVTCSASVPTFSTTPPPTATEEVLYSYALACSDPGGATPILTVGAGDDCGGALVDNGDGTGIYSFTPLEADGGTTCNLELVCGNGSDLTPQAATVIIDEVNQPPSMTNLPFVSVGPWTLPGSFQAAASDPDQPADNLSFDLVGDDCSFAVTVSATGLVSWTCGAAVESCTASVRVSDDSTPVMTDSADLALGCTSSSPTFHSSVPFSATENVAYIYDASCTDLVGLPVTIVINGSDSCDGSLVDNGDGTARYTFTPDETEGGGACVVAVDCDNGFTMANQLMPVIVSEDNQTPTLTNLPAGESGPAGLADSYQATASDADVPVQSLTYSSQGDDCSFGVTVSAGGLVEWTCGLVGESCAVTVRVSDNGGPPAFADADLSIDCVSSAPTWTSGAPTDVDEDVLYSYDATCTGGGVLTIVAGGNDTCAGVLIDNGDGTASYSFTPDETEGGTTCDVELVCGDGTDAATQLATVSIAETNQTPSLTNLPGVASGPTDAADSYQATASDGDLPPQILTFSSQGDTCSFGVTVSANGLVEWTCGSAGESCTVSVRLTDNLGPPVFDDADLDIDCVAAAPGWTSGAPTDVDENVLYSYDATCAGSGVLAITAGGNDTCAGLLVDNGDGSASYSFTPDETEGGTTCDVELVCGNGTDAATQLQTVTIGEINLVPALPTMPATVIMHWSGDGSYLATASDGDLPADTLTFSHQGDTCSFGVTVSATGLVEWMCAGAELCTVDVGVIDDGVPNLGTQSTLDIECTNTAPLWLSVPPTDATQNVPQQYDLDCDDPDPDLLLITVGAANTCDGTLIDNGDGTGSYTIDRGAGPPTCDLELLCDDGAVASPQNQVVNIN